MRGIYIILIAVLSIFIVSCAEKMEEFNQDKPSDIKSKIEVLYLHSTNRCTTCLSIEEQIRITINTYFDNEINSGAITVESFNIDEDANKHLAEKYQADGSTVIVNTYDKSGNLNSQNLTGFAFLNIYDEGTFVEKFKEIIEKELGKI